MIYDMHSDFLTFEADLQEKLSVESATKYSKRIVYAVWTTKLKKPVDFLRNVARRKPSLTAIEDMGFISPANLAILDLLKPAYASLTWNGENSLAGGTYSDCGLTKRGKWVIELFEKKKIVLDTAHLSRPAFFEMLSFTARKDIPIICSHTCFDGVYSHPRNLTDRQIRSIIKRRGIIGLALVPEFMSRPIPEDKSTAKIEGVVRQIDYFAQKFGTDNLAIGSDFYGSDNLALKNYRSFGWVKRRLVALGYSIHSIEGIFYKNAKNYFQIHATMS